MTNQREWLHEIREAVQDGEPTLVVCRTSATVRAVYRALTGGVADRQDRGWVGLQVATLNGLVAAAAPHVLAPEAADADEPELPKGHPWAKRLADRPGLRRLLRHHVARGHRLAASGHKPKGWRKELAELLDADWGKPDEVAGISRLLERSAPRGTRFAVGFADAPLTFGGRVSAVERRLLEHLGCRSVDSGRLPAADPTAGETIPAMRVHDVAAEARLAALQALEAGEQDVLILVPDDDSGHRVRAALQRNGILAAADGSVPLRNHALAAILRPLVAIFASGGQLPLDVADLRRLVTDPVLSRTPPSNADYMPVPDLDEQRASPRHLHDLLGECRRTRATLADWLTAVGVVVKRHEADLKRADADRAEGHRRRLASARVLQAVLRVLVKRVGAGQRLGDLARCVQDLGLADPTDRLGHAIIRALRDAGYRPASPDTYDDALASGVGSGRVDDGVQILAYGDYDGRPSGRLVLTGVHNKGLAAAPERDPFLRDQDLQALGLPVPAEAVRERLLLARWAASRAGSAIAVVAETDASGRRVAAPVGLPLRFAQEAPVGGAYGYDCRLPEATDRAAFAESAKPGDPIALQLDAEWARSGATFEGQPPRPPVELGNQSTISDHLLRDLPCLPERIRPWVGASGPHPETKTGLPPKFALSATRLTAFMQCPYRAFAQSVLRLEKREDVEEELDAREVGSALHDAIEEVLLGQQLAVPEAKLDTARRSLVKQLEKATIDAVKAAAKERLAGTEHESLGVARAGMTDRWNGQWRRYVVRLLMPLEALNSDTRKSRLVETGVSALVEATADVIAAGQMAKGPRKELASGITHAVLACGGDATALEKCLGAYAAAQNPKNSKILTAALARADSKKAIKKLSEAAGEAFGCVECNPDGDLQVVKCEHDLSGDTGASKTNRPFELKLGSASIPVHGRIDAVVLRAGDDKPKTSRYRVIDFKTGKWVPKPVQVHPSLIQPQLPFYALALTAAGPVRKEDRAPVVVEWIGYRAPRASDDTELPWSDEMASQTAKVFGEALDRARAGFYPLVPHDEACPLKKFKGAFCDYQEICRLRAAFGSGAVDESEQEVSP